MRPELGSCAPRATPTTTPRPHCLLARPQMKPTSPRSDRSTPGHHPGSPWPGAWSPTGRAAGSPDRRARGRVGGLLCWLKAPLLPLLPADTGAPS